MRPARRRWISPAPAGGSFSSSTAVWARGLSGGFVLRYELAAYLTAHEAAGATLDEGCLEICYENGVYLLLRRMQGVWYITDVFAAEETVAYEPVFFWRRIRRGVDFVLAHVLSGWRPLTERPTIESQPLRRG